MPVELNSELDRLGVAREVDLQATLDAANGALGSANIFTSTAAGLAGTANEQYFSVPSAESAEYLALYKNNAGAAQDTGKRYPSKAAIDQIFDQSSFTHSGYALAVVDSAGRMALSVRDDGTLDIAGVDDVASHIAETDATIFKSDALPRSGVVFSIQDAAGRSPLAVTEDGKVLVGGIDVAALSGAALGPLVAAVEDDVSDLQLWINGLPSIACWGDSLTAGGYPSALAIATGRTVRNGGVGGNYSYQVAARQGGRPTYITFVGGGIPASGAVTIDSFTVEPMTIYGTQTIMGSIGGIAGTLARQPDNSYTFTRTTAGAALDVPVALPFVPDVGQSDFEIAVIWAGRNNYQSPNQVLSDVRAMVNFLKPLNKRFVVMSPPNGDYAAEYVGGADYHYFTEIRDGLRNEFPNNFLDIWQILVESYDPGVPQDVIDYSRGITPSSLRSDALHFNTAGNLIIAAEVKKYLIDFKGY